MPVMMTKASDGASLLHLFKALLFRHEILRGLIRVATGREFDFKALSLETAKQHPKGVVIDVEEDVTNGTIFTYKRQGREKEC